MTDRPDIIDDTITTDLTAFVPQQHIFDHIVGNELRCSIHATCGAIRIKPTEVLVKGDDGQLKLVDMAMR